MKEVKCKSFPRKTSVDLSSPFASEDDEYLLLYPLPDNMDNGEEFRAEVSKEDFFFSSDSEDDE